MLSTKKRGGELSAERERMRFLCPSTALPEIQSNIASTCFYIWNGQQGYVIKAMHVLFSLKLHSYLSIPVNYLYVLHQSYLTITAWICQICLSEVIVHALYSEQTRNKRYISNINPCESSK